MPGVDVDFEDGALDHQELAKYLVKQGSSGRCGDEVSAGSHYHADFF